MFVGVGFSSGKLFLSNFRETHGFLASHGVVVFENSVRYQLLNHSGTKTKVEDDLLSAEELEWCRRMSEVREEKRPRCREHAEYSIVLAHLSDGCFWVCPKCRRRFPYEQNGMHAVNFFTCRSFLPELLSCRESLIVISM
jgi:hypothetical protein